MENTLENRSIFFNQYHRQNLLSNKGKCCLRDADFIDELEWIELKPLSSITDEDLLTAIHILDSKDEFTELGSLEIGKEIIQIVDDINSEVARNDIHPQYIFQFADYLRSEGYALPYMGLSVEKLQEYGWIKLK